MAIGANTCWEVQYAGSSSNGGGFDVGCAGFPTDLTVVSGGTGSTPVVSSASYNFASRNNGALLFIQKGTGLIPGFYPITSTASNQATLNAAIGAVALYGGATLLNTTAGCATTATTSAVGTWGIDYSRSTAAGIAFTDLVIDPSTNTNFTSSGFPVGKDMVGNTINVASGTGFTVQTVEVVSTATTTATCDKSLGTLSSTGGTGNLGGALAHPINIIGSVVQGNIIWTQYSSSAYTQTATMALASLGGTSATAPLAKLLGYYATRGDITVASVAAGTVTRPTLKLLTNSNLTAVNMNANGWLVSGFIIDCNNLTGSVGLSTNSSISFFSNNKVINYKSIGINIQAYSAYCDFCEVTGGTGTGIAAASFSAIAYCYAHGNAGVGIVANGQNTIVSFNLVTGNTGSTSDGIQHAGAIVLNNTVDSNGRHGINNTASAIVNTTVRNNIVTNHTASGACGIKYSSTAGNAFISVVDGNAFYNNNVTPYGSAAHIGDVGAVNAINGVGQYFPTFDVSCSVSPYVGGGNYQLNTTAGGGAALTGTASPGILPGITQTGSMSFGALQPAATGSTTYLINKTTNIYLPEGS